jgi:hypothetical protein
MKGQNCNAGVCKNRFGLLTARSPLTENSVSASTTGSGGAASSSSSGATSGASTSSSGSSSGGVPGCTDRFVFQQTDEATCTAPVTVTIGPNKCKRIEIDSSRLVEQTANLNCNVGGKEALLQLTLTTSLVTTAVTARVTAVPLDGASAALQFEPASCAPKDGAVCASGQSAFELSQTAPSPNPTLDLILTASGSAVDIYVENIQ